jgi:hypothetical protein
MGAPSGEKRKAYANFSNPEEEMQLLEEHYMVLRTIAGASRPIQSGEY